MTGSPLLGPDVRSFLHTVVQTTWGLEILLLMKASAPRLWTPAELNAEIRGSIPLIEDVLAIFEQGGIVKRTARGFVFAPEQSSVNDTVEELACVHAQYPLAVVKEILRAPNEKIHMFVEAFRLKND
jgi:hypothetical protein